MFGRGRAARGRGHGRLRAREPTTGPTLQQQIASDSADCGHQLLRPCRHAAKRARRVRGGSRPARLPFHRPSTCGAPEPRLGPRAQAPRCIAIGDSVMLASAPELAEAMPGIYINAQVSRAMIAGIVDRAGSGREQATASGGDRGPRHQRADHARPDPASSGRRSGRPLAAAGQHVRAAVVGERGQRRRHGARGRPVPQRPARSTGTTRSSITPTCCGATASTRCRSAASYYAKVVRKVGAARTAQAAQAAGPHRPSKPVQLSGFLLHPNSRRVLMPKAAVLLRGRSVTGRPGARRKRLGYEQARDQLVDLGEAARGWRADAGAVTRALGARRATGRDLRGVAGGRARQAGRGNRSERRARRPPTTIRRDRSERPPGDQDVERAGAPMPASRMRPRLGCSLGRPRSAAIAASRKV